MKKLLILFTLLLLTLECAWAAPESDTTYRIHVQVLRSSGSDSAARIRDEGSWKEALRSGQLQLLGGSSVLVRNNVGAYAMTGKKVPIGYPDPRTGSYQVQYVDAGFKLDARVSEGEQGTLLLDCLVEHRALSDSGALHRDMEGVRAQTVVQLKPGQFGVISSTRGRLTSRYIKRVYPSANFSENDALMIAISVEKI